MISYITSIECISNTFRNGCVENFRYRPNAAERHLVHSNKKTVTGKTLAFSIYETSKIWMHFNLKIVMINQEGFRLFFSTMDNCSIFPGLFLQPWFKYNLNFFVYIFTYTQFLINVYRFYYLICIRGSGLLLDAKINILIVFFLNYFDKL